MNPTLNWFFSELHFRFMTRASQIRKIVRADVAAGAPRPGDKPAGQKTLLALCETANGSHPYYLAQTVTALAIGTAATAGACLFAAREPLDLWTAIGAVALAIVALVAFHQTIARRFGPRFIDEARFDEARTAPARSGDPQTPMSLPVLIVLLALALLDGAMAGTTISAAALGTLLTPSQALFAGIVFSVVLTAVIYHLAHLAAREAAINARRNLVRALLSTNRPADVQRAREMMAVVGPALGHDYSRRANGFAARVVLCVLILALAAGTFTVRVRAEAVDVVAEAQSPSTP